MKKTGGIFMSIATEIVTMKTLQEVTKDSFISIVDSLEKDYHSKQQGLLTRNFSITKKTGNGL